MAYNARAEPLFCSLNLLFSDVRVAVAVVVILNSLKKKIVVTATARRMPDESKTYSPKAKLLIFTLVCFWLALFGGWDNSNINIFFFKVTFYD